MTFKKYYQKLSDNGVDNLILYLEMENNKYFEYLSIKRAVG
jgi:hypothetical protein